MLATNTRPLATIGTVHLTTGGMVSAPPANTSRPVSPSTPCSLLSSPMIQMSGFVPLASVMLTDGDDPLSASSPHQAVEIVGGAALDTVIATRRPELLGGQPTPVAVKET